jgi:hypothetical protein
MPFARLEMVRSVAVPMTTVRSAVARTLREVQFAITAERVTGLEGRRGSQLAAGAFQYKKSPVGIKIDFSGDADASVIAIHLFDRWRAPGGKAWGTNRTYFEIFTEIAQRLDGCFIALDPTVVLTPPEFTSTAATVEVFERTNLATGVAGHKASQRVDQWLTGTPKAAPGGPQVVIAAPDAEAIIDAMRVQEMLTVALLVSRIPGSMPPALTADVERVAAAIERVLDDANPGMVPVIEIAAEDRPVITFLHEQARVRHALPLRTMQRCTTCRHERVVNPDYQRLVERNRKIRGITGFLGASISSRGVSPFILVGRILPLVKMDPNYVCPRCQGLDAEERVVVFCPHCGDRRDEAALRTCPRCQHDFRKALDKETLWLPVGTAAERFTPPPPSVLQPTVAATPEFPAGYYADPEGRFEARWWDGFQWTAQVISSGRAEIDRPAASASTQEFQPA